MDNANNHAEIEKNFGSGVLLKLIKKNVGGIEISTVGKKFTSNISKEELNAVVDSILKLHNIRLKVTI